jgi:hypothetical protein
MGFLAVFSLGKCLEIDGCDCKSGRAVQPHALKLAALGAGDQLLDELAKL